MNKPKFDGPSFVNPAHTSYNLDKNQQYQTPTVNLGNKDTGNKKEVDKNSHSNNLNNNNNKNISKGKPRGGKYKI
jgi:hypothetical protein